jgi:hypothetical protein
MLAYHTASSVAKAVLVVVRQTDGLVWTTDRFILGWRTIDNLTELLLIPRQKI